MVSKDDIPPDVRKDIMKATLKAIRKHGYADLTMEKISDEFGKCKSTLHYHYGTKEELIVEFIRFLQEGFKKHIMPESDDPLKKLEGIIDRMMFGTKDGKVPERFHTVLLELRAQAHHNDRYREQITENDRFIHGKVTEVIEEGIEKDVFKNVDPSLFATIILSSIDGARARQISTDRDAIQKARGSLDRILDEMLLKEK